VAKPRIGFGHRRLSLAVREVHEKNEKKLLDFVD
jgi:hypothetical protein